MKKLLLVSAAFFLVFSCANVIMADMTADEVIAMHLEKTGGIDNYKKVNTVRMSGKAFIGQMTADFTVENMAPNKFHMKIVSDMFTMETGSDGEQVWQQPPMVEGFVMTEEEDLPSQLERMVMHPFIDYKDRGVEAKLVGEEQVTGADCYKIEWVTGAGDTSYIYFDKENFNQVKKVEAESETMLSKFEEVGGITFPHKMVQNIGGQRFMMIFNNIETNIELDSSHFIPPADSLLAPPEVMEQIKEAQKQQQQKQEQQEGQGE